MNKLMTVFACFIGVVFVFLCIPSPTCACIPSGFVFGAYLGVTRDMNEEQTAETIRKKLEGLDVVAEQKKAKENPPAPEKRIDPRALNTTPVNYITRDNTIYSGCPALPGNLSTSQAYSCRIITHDSLIAEVGWDIALTVKPRRILSDVKLQRVKRLFGKDI